MADPSRLDELMRTVAESLSEPGDIEQTLTRITHAACAAVPRADFASISIRHHNGRLETVAPTNPMVYRVDAIQYRLNEGPCYDAVTTEDVIYCRDLGNDQRWPNFGPRASAFGLMSQLAIGLAHPGGSFTALNLYSSDLYAFEDHQPVADLFASQAKVVLRYAQEVQKLTTALSIGTTIERATGIVMERHGIDAEDAFERLMRLAQSGHVELVELAERVVKRADHEDLAENASSS